MKPTNIEDIEVMNSINIEDRLTNKPKHVIEYTDNIIKNEQKGSDRYD